jgi:hypothetical protein
MPVSEIACHGRILPQSKPAYHMPKVTVWGMARDACSQQGGGYVAPAGYKLPAREAVEEAGAAGALQIGLAAAA